MNRQAGTTYKEFRTQVQDSSIHLIYTWNLTLEAYYFFDGLEDTSPIQCDRIAKSLHRTCKPIGDFYGLLDSQSQLPPGVGPLRYPLVVKLHHVEAQMQELCRLIAVFRVTSQESSKQALTRRSEIRHRLGLLANNCEDALHCMAILLDQTRFQERRFQSLEVGYQVI